MFPPVFRQNDTLSFETVLDSKYDDFTLTYYLNSLYSTTATFTDGKFVVFETSTDWAPGTYDVQGVAEKGAERYTVEVGRTDILPDLSIITDSSSHVKKVLDAIEATLEGTASKEQESYEIAGRSLKNRSIEELLMLRDRYKQEWALEEKAIALANGTFSNTIKVRFG